ncbi:hypothetical protein EJ06DRAFT_571748 [Trichodelitschia bisporula]|uniref:Uncharacterized protein n=1 Tax=Trichodelitschia bisporula TaxID=703511 RepID=A0A6G1I616_9PEZI|nr:hypothetical protein EJ06DRAFT_571748 [Trichodelitschia bisporula]
MRVTPWASVSRRTQSSGNEQWSFADAYRKKMFTVPGRNGQSIIGFNAAEAEWRQTAEEVSGEWPIGVDEPERWIEKGEGLWEIGVNFDGGEKLLADQYWRSTVNAIAADRMIWLHSRPSVAD